MTTGRINQITNLAGGGVGAGTRSPSTPRREGQSLVKRKRGMPESKPRSHDSPSMPGCTRRPSILPPLSSSDTSPDAGRHAALDEWQANCAMWASDGEGTPRHHVDERRLHLGYLSPGLWDFRLVSDQPSTDPISAGDTRPPGFRRCVGARHRDSI
jgi:hypothetical protein